MEVAQTLGKSHPMIQRMAFFKDSAIEVVKGTVDFDKKIVDSKIEYREKIHESQREEYGLLEKNLEMAQSEDERRAIREQMADIRRYELEEMKEYNDSLNSVQDRHNEQMLKVLFAVGVATGLVKVSKPLIKAGKSLLTAKI